MHLVVDTALTVREMFKSVADVNPTFMAASEKATALRELVAVETQVAELRLRVMATADDVAAASGDRDVASWLSRTQGLRRGDCAADLRLARVLDGGRPLVATALREGRVTLSQARVIVTALEDLPDRVGVDVLDRAEAALVGFADEFDPTALAKLGRRILGVVAPEVEEAEEERRLRDAERYAAERQRLRLRAVGDGLTRISGVIPDTVAARLARYLHAFTNPRLSDGAVRGGAEVQGEDERSGFGSPVSRPRRLAEAFAQLLETWDAKRLPVHGGDATHLMVTISLDDLRTGLGVAALDNGTPGEGLDAMTASQVRRLACNAQLIPAVLGADSEVLDLGRGARLFTRAQRRALALRDQTCRAEGCSVPGTWSEAHHLVPWSRGGGTDLDNSALLCSHHHHRAHDPAYDLTRHASGDLRFHRRR